MIKIVSIVRIDIFGKLYYDEFASSMETIVNSNNYPANVDIIWDLRNADFS